MGTKTKKRKTTAAAVPVPQSREDAAVFIAEIGERDRDLQRIQTEMNGEMAAIKAGWEALAASNAERIKVLTEGLQIWCEANRAELTGNGKKKTASFATGEVAWRNRPPSVSIRGQDAVLAALTSAKLGKFIRTKPEINKEAILSNPQAVADIPGISIKRGEDFIVTPFAAELAEGV